MKDFLLLSVLLLVKYYAKDGKVYTVTNGKKELQSNKTPNFVTQNDNAVQYYKEALELKNKIINSSLISLKASNAVDENGNPITSYDYTNEGFFDYDIFKELNNTNYICTTSFFVPATIIYIWF